MLERLAHVDVIDKNGETALFYAVHYEHCTTCCVLLEGRADAHCVNNIKQSPSSIALSRRVDGWFRSSDIIAIFSDKARLPSAGSVSTPNKKLKTAHPSARGLKKLRKMLADPIPFERALGNSVGASIEIRNN